MCPCRTPASPARNGGRRSPHRLHFEGRPAQRLPERLDLCVGRAGRSGLDSVGNEVAMAPCDVHHVYVVRKQLYISDEHEPDSRSAL
jgi:hypothetical protein